MTAHKPDWLDRLNRVCKWRNLLAGRIVGTRAKDDPQSQGFTDLFEKLIILRCEMSAVTRLLLDRGVFRIDTLNEQIGVEADALNEMYAQKFPGVMGRFDGLEFDARCAETMKGWPV